MRTHDLALALALIGASQGCKSNEAGRASRAADRANTSSDKLDQARSDLARKEASTIPAIEKVTTRSLEVAQAEQEFELRRDLLLHSLRARHDAIARQAPMITGLVDILPLTDAGRADVREKLAIFTLRIEDTAHGIEDLELVPSATWTKHADEVEDMVKHLEDARGAAWRAIRAAPRIAGA